VASKTLSFAINYLEKVQEVTPCHYRNLSSARHGLKIVGSLWSPPSIFSIISWMKKSKSSLLVILINPREHSGRVIFDITANLAESPSDFVRSAGPLLCCWWKH
jgi:hypothetical protein